MKTREEIYRSAWGENELLPRGSGILIQQLEVLLDIRDLLIKQNTIPQSSPTTQLGQAVCGVTNQL